MNAPETESDGLKQRFAEIYDRPEIARHYQGTLLQACETELWRELAARPQQVDLLDLGIGLGRTTFFFLPVARRYVGVDLSSAMIAQCRERFAEAAPAVGKECFHVADAADLKECADGAFEAVLFSCNGIDCLSPAARGRCLSEVRRVLRPGGKFEFSSHNARAIPQAYGDGSAIPSTRREAIRRHNGDWAQAAVAGQIYFWDGVYGDAEGLLRHVYVLPAFQCEQLAAAGFKEIEVLASESGRWLTPEEQESTTELSLHYRCRRV